MKERQPISFTIIHDLPNVRGLSFDDALNGLGLCEGRASRHESSNLAQCLIVAQMFNIPLMPCFCKTTVICRCGLIKTNLL